MSLKTDQAVKTSTSLEVTIHTKNRPNRVVLQVSGHRSTESQLGLDGTTQDQTRDQASHRRTRQSHRTSSGPDTWHEETRHDPISTRRGTEQPDMTRSVPDGAQNNQTGPDRDQTGHRGTRQDQIETRRGTEEPDRTRSRPDGARRNQTAPDQDQTGHEGTRQDQIETRRGTEEPDRAGPAADGIRADQTGPGRQQTV